MNLLKIKQIDKKILWGLLGAIFLIEGLWAWQVLKQPVTVPVKISAPPVSKIEPTALSLTAPKTTLKVGEKLTVGVNISSSKITDGADIIILYDPEVLEVVLNSQGEPVTLGSIYEDYPANLVDEKIGKITVSGITSTKGGVVPKGVFGSIVFQAKTAGVANIRFDYTPGKTTDSNVVESKTTKDLLEKADNLDLNITQ